VPDRYVRVMSNKGLLGIPVGIEHFDEIVVLLSRIKPIEISRIQEWQKSLTIMLGSIILFTAMLWSTSRSIGIPLVFATAGSAIWMFILFRRNPNISRAAKRIGWVYLFVLVICAMKFLMLLYPPSPTAH